MFCIDVATLVYSTIRPLLAAAYLGCTNGQSVNHRMLMILIKTHACRVFYQQLEMKLKEDLFPLEQNKEDEDNGLSLVHDAIIHSAKTTITEG